MAVKGKTNNPNGRKKGVPNKATTQAREAIAMFVDNNAHRLEAWLDQVAHDSPKDAFQLFQSVIEYHVPKLSRSEQKTEISGTLHLEGILNELDGKSADLPED